MLTIAVLLILILLVLVYGVSRLDSLIAKMNLIHRSLAGPDAQASEKVIAFVRAGRITKAVFEYQRETGSRLPPSWK